MIIHYHTFKNAGTSVDEMLKRNFAEHWEEAEFRLPGAGKHSNVDVVTQYLRERPNLQAFSSHTALLPLPNLGRPIFPIVFVRHPLDRLRSAYTFERRQVADTHGARLAKAQDFSGYLRELLASPHNRQARNFQTSRLACNEPAANGPELDRAMRAFDALPFVGLVEAYDASLQRLQQKLAPLFPAFKAVVVHKNRTAAAPEPLARKLEAMAKAIGAELYGEVRAANADDIALFERARALYAAA